MLRTPVAGAMSSNECIQAIYQINKKEDKCMINSGQIMLL